MAALLKTVLPWLPISLKVRKCQSLYYIAYKALEDVCSPAPPHV